MDVLILNIGTVLIHLKFLTPTRFHLVSLPSLGLTMDIVHMGVISWYMCVFGVFLDV